MESDETNIEKTFELINGLNGNLNLLTIKVPYHTSTRQINISKAINDIHSSGFSLQRCLLFYFDSNKRLYVHIGTYPFPKHFELFLKFQLFLQTTIKLQYRKISNPNSPKNEKKPNAQSEQYKRTRKEKTIGQAQEMVSKWRNLYETVDSFGKKMYTLESAAQKLGMQRKTLDDYFYKMKSAQGFGFDFEKFKNQKIGFLRQFVKEKKKQKNVVNVSAQNINQLLNIKPSIGQGMVGTSGKGFGMGPQVSYAPCNYQMSYPPQKPPEDEIDKYFLNEDEEVSSSESDQSD